jgi:hypothetical protein
LDESQISFEIRLGDETHAVLATPANCGKCLLYLVQHAIAACDSGATIHFNPDLFNREVRVVIQVESSQNRASSFGTQRNPIGVNYPRHAEIG